MTPFIDNFLTDELPQASNLFYTFIMLIRYELLLAYRRCTDLLNPLWFFMLSITLFPLAISPESQQLRAIAPGVIGVATLFATLLSLDRLFHEDYADGSLHQMLLSPQPLAILALTKVTAHWIISSLPLLLVAPLLGIFLHLSPAGIRVLLVSLLLATPLLNLLGAIGSALTVNLRNSGVLLALLILPLYIPVLIFGASAVTMADAGVSVTGQLAMLTSLLILAVCLAPAAIAAALRISMA